jgi:hypothetical protein
MFSRLRWHLCVGILLAAVNASAQSEMTLGRAGAVALVNPGARVATSPGFVYVAGEGGSALQIIDVATPSLPTLCGTVSNFYATDVATSGRYVVAISGGRVLVLDAVNPCAPVTVGSMPLPYAFRIAMAGRYAYVLLRGGTAGALVVVDLAVPTAPVERGRISLTAPADLDVSGGRVYVADGAAGLRIIDVGNPSAPAQVAARTFGQAGALAQGVAVSGTYAYLTTHRIHSHYGIPLAGDVHVIDVYDGYPVEVGSFSDGSCPEEITVSGAYAYVIEDASEFESALERVRVYDVSNPSAPTLVASAAAGLSQRAIASGSFVFTTNANYHGTQELSVLKAYWPPRPVGAEPKLP